MCDPHDHLLVVQACQLLKDQLVCNAENSHGADIIDSLASLHEVIAAISGSSLCHMKIFLGMLSVPCNCTACCICHD